jgi:hypothetical protein
VFFELRTYDLAPGKAPAYLEFFRTFGVSRVTRHLPMLGYWMVDTGRLNRIEHLWAYDSFEQRDACRAGLVTDREWMQDFVPKAFVDVVAQENRIMALDQASPAFEVAVAARNSHHADQAPDVPMFAPGFQGLSLGDAVSGAGDLVAAFTVISGVQPGTRVTLSAGTPEALCGLQPGIHSHEILRPLSLSPLQ